jgi:hypothetical protein
MAKHIYTKGVSDSRVEGQHKFDTHSDVYDEISTPMGSVPTSKGKVIKSFKIKSGKDKGCWRVIAKQGKDSFTFTDYGKEKPEIGEYVVYIHPTNRIMYFGKNKR